jgi:hypothetical protein
MQKLVQNGHAWSSIKQYTLAEIGIFFRIIIETEKLEQINNLYNLWIGSNADKKGLDSIIKELEKKKIEHDSAEVVAKDWKRLAMFMKGKK